MSSKHGWIHDIAPMEKMKGDNIGVVHNTRIVPLN